MTEGTTDRRAMRLRIAALVAVVVGTGFALTALALVLPIVVRGGSLAWLPVVLFAIGGTLTTATAGALAWVLAGALAPSPEPVAHERTAPPAAPSPETPPAPLPAAHEDTAATDRADASFQAQRRLLDDIRHELKTPITIVRGHLEIMDAADGDDVNAVRQLGIAELDRMTRLIGDIDVLATVEAGQVEIGDVHLPTLSARLFELVAVIPGHAWSIEETSDAVIRGDRDRLLQAWLQLADNAAKYTPAGTPIEVGCAAHAAAAQFWVRDHGPGVPPALRHRIFRRFDRGNGRRTVGGSGLGLAIVDAIAKAHGGSCRVADTPGGGATFTLEIPIGTSAALPAPVRAGDVLQQREANP
ncbi:sensor histidine kinase [Microbacterium sp. No. 7]|uniref:sensor histidine kinase n=1 Tax=Microbacterium sp. No. 7 TaxID=1714373 RepID=UPI0006ED15D9|nr:HAMP domain-containing sensor histidine kinase [Microbacterium sp. No. 7]ALJ19864.1 ATPase [Microbacterium sp. No. 7]